MSDSDYVFDCQDGEEAVLWQSDRVKARKPHDCCECKHPIFPGETYVREKSLFDGRWELYRTCLCCDSARCAIAKAYANGDFTACIIRGGLWNAVKEGLRDGWLEEEQVNMPVTST